MATNKKETEAKMNEVLTASKKHDIVVNNLFHTIQDFVGFKSLDQPTVLEPLFPTQHFIAHESIETNRKEVGKGQCQGLGSESAQGAMRGKCQVLMPFHLI